MVKLHSHRHHRLFPRLLAALPMLAAFGAFGCSHAADPQADREEAGKTSSADVTCDPVYTPYGYCLYQPLLTNVDATTSTITLHWWPYSFTAATNIVPDHIEILRDGADIGRASWAATAYTDGSVSGRHLYTVCAVYSSLNVSECSQVYGTTTPNPPPPPPAGGNSPLIAATSRSAGHYDVEVIGAADRAVYNKQWNADHWFPSMTGYTDLGGEAPGLPELTTSGPAVADLFVRGAGNHLFHNNYPSDAACGGRLPCYDDLGGDVSDIRPSAVSWGQGRLDVFVVGGADHALYHKGWDGQRWLPSQSGWDDLGGSCAGVKAVSWGANRIDIFVVGAADGALYHKAWDGSQWTPSPTGYDNLGGSIAAGSYPAAVSWSSGRLDVFVVGAADGALYHKAWDGAEWLPSMTGYERLGGSIAGSPSAVSMSANRLDVFVKGAADGALYHKAWNGSAWAPSVDGYDRLGGNLTSSPTAVSWGPNRLDVFVAGPNNALFHKGWDGTQWVPSETGYDALGGSILQR